MNKFYFTSDFHFGHDKDFVYAKRGFNNIIDMNQKILYNINETVDYDDTLFILGDIMLGDMSNIKYLKQIKCNDIRIILGNHDTDNRTIEYQNCYNVTNICFADRIKYKGYHFFLTHYPCLSGNGEKDKLKGMTLNLCGHTHQTNAIDKNMPWVYNVGVDANNCTPVLIDDIIDRLELNWIDYKNAQNDR